MINYLALLIALLLSVVAAYYSIVGLATIFAAAVIPIIIMGASLEAAKVVSASWLYRNWTHAPRVIKYYLTVAVLLLSFITSMGIFGFLSKAHTEVSAVSGAVNVQLQTINQQLDIEKNRLDILLKQASQYSGPVRRFERDIKTAQDRIVELTQQRLPLLQEENKITAEIGPIKYIAELIYGSSDQTMVEKAVRAVIILIVVVFDPLALILLIAANHGIKQAYVPKKKEVKPSKRPRGRPPKLKPMWMTKAGKLIEKRLDGTITIDPRKIRNISDGGSF